MSNWIVYAENAVYWNVDAKGDDMTTQEFLRRYRWLPAEPDDRLDWLVMVGAAWMAYAVAAVVWVIWRL